MTEHGPEAGGPPERPSHEHELPPYVRTAHFRDEHTAGRVYFQVQDALLTGPPNDLSAYRLRLRQVWHVAVLGAPPPRGLARRIDRLLASGDTTPLPAEVLQRLAHRRQEQIQQGPWTEGHYRPGRPL